MELSEAINLIKDGIKKENTPQVWADLGAGTGLFTKALAKLLPEQSIVYAIDTSAVVNKISLPGVPTHIKPMQVDMTAPMLDRSLDGILMANSLHFVEDKKAMLQRWMKSLSSGGRLIIVEYDLNKANPWVPFPITINNLRSLMLELGLLQFSKLAEKPSLYNTSMIYSVSVSH